MKLILCPNCMDVVKLASDIRACKCGSVAGHYKEDGWHARISDNAVAIGVDNNSLRHAFYHLHQYKGEFGPSLRTWVFPLDYHRIERVPRSELT